MPNMYFSDILTIILAGWTVSSVAFLFPKGPEDIYMGATSVEILALQHTALYRNRRSSDCTPDHLDVRFTANHTLVDLALHRNTDININVPIFVSRNGTIVQENLKNTENVALYQDIESGSALLVQCDLNKTTLELYGTFYNGFEELMIVPNPDDDTQEQLPVLNSEKDPTGLMPGSDEGHVYGDESRKREFSIMQHAVFKGKTLRPGSIDYIEIEDLHPNLQTGSIYSARVKLANTKYQVELLMVADYSVYNFWQTKASSITEAKELMRQFYAFILNGMDLRYKSVSGSGFNVTVLFAGLYIAETPSAAPWTENIKIQIGGVYHVNSSDALANFRTWVNNRIDLPGHDHAMLFTKYDLEYGGSNNNLGLAYVGATCKTYSQSIVEDEFNARMVAVSAHELGHSLGARHDGNADGIGDQCSPAHANIMAASITLYGLGTTEFKYNKNLWKFSSCSISYFQNYINSLNSINCLTSLSSGYNSSALYPYDKQHAGQAYLADTQCQYSLGSDSHFCRGFYKGNYTNMCSLFYCAIPGTSSCTRLIVMEKTTCGDGKWCEAGECVTSAQAPSVSDLCPLGDQPGLVAVGLACTELIVQRSYYCYYPYYLDTCCESCMRAYTNITGCEYGDKTNCSALRRYGCYSNEALCCGTCLPQKGTILGCEYGDKATGCNVGYCPFYDPDTLAKCCETCYVPPSSTSLTAAPTTLDANPATITASPTQTKTAAINISTVSSTRTSAVPTITNAKTTSQIAQENRTHAGPTITIAGTTNTTSLINKTSTFTPTATVETTTTTTTRISGSPSTTITSYKTTATTARGIVSTAAATNHSAAAMTRTTSARIVLNYIITVLLIMLLISERHTN